MAITPPWPQPLPYTANLMRRFARGWISWFGLLNEWDFRIALGEINLFGLRIFLINDRSLIRRVLVEEVESFPKHPYTMWILEPLIGQGIFSVNGEEWARQRRLIDQAFQAAQLERVFPAMAAATEAMLNQLENQGSAPSGVVVEMESVMTRFTADVIVRTIFSRPLSEKESEPILEAFGRFQRKAARALVLRFLRLPRRFVQNSLRQDASVIRQWIQGAIEERLASPQEVFTDLLACLIAAVDPQTGTCLSAEELVDQVCVLFLAGHETSASALTSACWLLSLDQEVQSLLWKEVDAVEGQFTPQILRQMPYATAVFQETLRLYPPICFFIRERRNGDTSLSLDAMGGGLEALAKSRCPMGSMLTLSPWVIHRHEDHWPEPQKFRPERFLADINSLEDQRCSRDAWLPFGLGPRKCPGAAFAQQEALLVIAELLRRYCIFPPDEGNQPEWIGRLTLRSAAGVSLRLRSRKAEPVKN